VLRRDLTDEVLEALSPFLTGEVAVGPPPVPTAAELARLALHPDDDLAPNRPGEALRALDGDRERPLLRLRPDPRRSALAAQETVGEALDRLEGLGWRTLHSVPLPGGDRIHHLLIGPGGAYALHALHAHRRRVRIAPPLVGLGRGTPVPLLDRVRADADRASFALATEVRPVLVLVDPSAVHCPVPSRDVRVLRSDDLPALGRRGALLKPGDADGLFATARDRHTWLRL
jgi:hypothetical protein